MKSPFVRSSAPNRYGFDLLQDHLNILNWASNVDRSELRFENLPENMKRNMTRGTRSLVGVQIFRSYAERVYQCGVNSRRGGGGGELVDGGGPLTLTVKTMETFCLRLITHILHQRLGEGFSILWVRRMCVSPLPFTSL